MDIKNILVGPIGAVLLMICVGLPQISYALSTVSDRATDELQLIVTPLPDSLQKKVDILHKALVGEIAFQRGSYELAGQYYIDAAKMSTNASLAEFATRSALLIQDYDTAVKHLSYVLMLKPENVEALHLAFLLAIKKGDEEMGMAYLRQLVVISTNAGKNGYLETFQFLTSGIENIEQRLTLGRRLIEGHQDDPQALFALANLEKGAGNIEIAEKLVRKVLTLRSDWYDAQMFLVSILKIRDDKVGARTTLELMLAAKPQDSKLRANYAKLLLEQNDLPAAKQQFELLYKGNPEDGDALFALGLLALQAEQRDEGKKYLEILYNLGAHQDDAAFYLGQIAQDAGKNDEALRWYSHVEVENKFEAQVRVAKIYAQQGAISRAREILRQIRSQVPDDPLQIYLIEADILREAKQYTTAMEILTTVIDANKGNHDLLYARAIIAAQIGQFDLLERDLKFIINEDPKHAEALNALGYTLASETTRYQEALSYIQRALDLNPNNPAILDSMGWVQYRMGDSAKALEYLKRAVGLLQDPEISAHLGEVLWSVGDKDQARKVWQEALNKTPNSPYILKMQERYGVQF